jgi:hypothetical protein
VVTAGVVLVVVVLVGVVLAGAALVDDVEEVARFGGGFLVVFFATRFTVAAHAFARTRFVTRVDERRQIRLSREALCVTFVT